METNYIIILDYSAGELIKIKLTPEEIEESEKYDDFETFLSTLEEKYEIPAEGLPVDVYWRKLSGKNFWILKTRDYDIRLR